MNIQSALVRSVLEKWQHFEWSVQGFGMARTKIADVGRIHVWDLRLRTPLVSDIHAHPWPLKSTVISGELINQRFLSAERVEVNKVALKALETVVDGQHWMPYISSIIKTGEGGGLTGDPKPVWLRLGNAGNTEFFVAGDTYEQAAQEVHRSVPMDGTVTLMERPQGPPLQETLVYWPAGTEWVSAEPRPVDTGILDRPLTMTLESVINYALQRWAAV